MKKDMTDLEIAVGFSFKNKTKLIFQSFIHRSYINESPKDQPESNERLEFLGDAVLSLIVSTYIYKKFPTHPEGDLTNFRSSLVKTTSLAQTAKKIGLDSYLSLGRGENSSGGRTNPSILADTFEAFLGAIYLDFGLSYCIKIIEKVLFPNLDEIIKSHTYRDYKSIFQEITQEKAKKAPVYELLESKGPDHAKQFTIGVYVGDQIIAKGVGKNKQQAEQEAARHALDNYHIK
jgi:ribonuclease III